MIIVDENVIPNCMWASHVKRTGSEYFLNTYSATIRVETESNAVIFSSAESNIANPLLINSAKEDEGIVKPPRDKLSKYLFSKWIPFSLNKQDLQIMQLERYCHLLKKPHKDANHLSQ